MLMTSLERQKIFHFSKYEFSFNYVPFTVTKKGNFEFIRLFAPHHEIFNHLNQNMRHRVDLAIIHLFLSIWIMILILLSFLYYFTDKGSNSRVHNLLSSDNITRCNHNQNSNQQIGAKFNCFTVLDVAMVRKNKELIELHQKIGVESNNHSCHLSSIGPHHYFAKEELCDEMIKIEYSPLDTYGTIIGKLSNFILFDYFTIGIMTFMGTTINKVTPVHVYGIKPGSIFIS